MEETTTREFTIPGYRKAEFVAKLDKANRRLDKAGIAERFNAQYERFMAKKVVGGIELPDGTTMFGTEVTVPFYKVTMDTFTLSKGQYTFVASLIPEEAGMTVHAAPGQSLEGWTRPAADDMTCEHCNINRYRKRLYVVRDDATGQLIQVGHNCVELYTGLEIKGLWALEFDIELQSFADEDRGSGYGVRDYSVEIDRVLGYSFAFSSEGKNYVSKARAFDGEATVDTVKTALFSPPKKPSDYRAQAAWQEFIDTMRQGEEFAKNESLIADIKASAETLRSGSDFADNMAIILAGESGRVSDRNVGILASLVAVYAREKELRVERERAPKAASGFLAPVKTRVRDFSIVLKTVKEFDGAYGTTTLFVGWDKDDHVVKWFASGSFSLDTGDTLVLKAATVKAHEQYQGTDQTVITRGSVDVDATDVANAKNVA